MYMYVLLIFYVFIFGCLKYLAKHRFACLVCLLPIFFDLKTDGNSSRSCESCINNPSPVQIDPTSWKATNHNGYKGILFNFIYYNYTRTKELKM